MRASKIIMYLGWIKNLAIWVRMRKLTNSLDVNTYNFFACDLTYGNNANQRMVSVDADMRR